MPDTSKPNPDYVSAPFEFSEWTPDHGTVLWKESRREGTTLFLEGTAEDGTKLTREWRWIPDNGVFRPADWKGELNFHKCSCLCELEAENVDLRVLIQQLQKERAGVVLKGGVCLTPAQCKDALEAAMQIIESVGTTGIHHKIQAAQKWMSAYFPNWA
jgi:hypothetical protein